MASRIRLTPWLLWPRWPLAHGEGAEILLEALSCKPGDPALMQMNALWRRAVVDPGHKTVIDGTATRSHRRRLT